MTTYAATVRHAVPALLVLLGACNAIFGVEKGTLGTGGHGGVPVSSGSSSSSSSGGTGGAPGGTGGALEDAGDGGDAEEGGSDAGPVSLAGCVLLLHFDEASWAGAGAVLDSSGQGNHGTAMGTAAPDAAGRIGGAAQFDGGGYIRVPSSASLQFTTALTYAVWVYPTALNGGTNEFSPGVLSKRLGFEDDVAFTLFFYKQNHAFADLQNVRVETSTPFANASWSHVAVVYDADATDPNARARIYVNGVLDVTHTADPVFASNNEELRVGDLPGGGNPFQGKIDEVAVWTRALSAAEVKGLYDNKGFF